jgi:hypothetical protein
LGKLHIAKNQFLKWMYAFGGYVFRDWAQALPLAVRTQCMNLVYLGWSGTCNRLATHVRRYCQGIIFTDIIENIVGTVGGYRWDLFYRLRRLSCLFDKTNRIMLKGREPSASMALPQPGWGRLKFSGPFGCRMPARRAARAGRSYWFACFDSIVLVTEAWEGCGSHDSL